MLQGKGFIFSDKAASIYVGIGLAHQDMIVRQKSEGHPFLEYHDNIAPAEKKVPHRIAGVNGSPRLYAFFPVAGAYLCYHSR